ncbi:MAG: YidB family protein [Burkholderiaceae bacterium]|nr:YidB family protein [Burkholderiaceae bacterium]
MQSWISTGQNLPISPQQLAQVFGADQMQQMARQTGLTPDAFGSQFSQLLPQLIDQLTPQGRVPDNGLDDALGALAKFLR